MNQRRHFILSLLGAVMLLGLFVASDAVAQVPTTPCTDIQGRITAASGMADGIFNQITTFVKTSVMGASQQLFQAFTGSSAYQTVVAAAMTLMIVIYAIGFTIGVVQATFGQALIRAVKMGIILSLISPAGWAFFSSTVVTFFNNGTDELIGIVMAIGTGGSAVPGRPFAALEGLAHMVISPDFIIAVVGAASTGGPFGLIMSSLMGFCFIGLFRLLLKGIQIYAISFVVRALLLGLAPIFIVFLLFDRTRQTFTGWVNALVNMSLQPILFFTFISFFITMMTSSSNSLLTGVEFCWVETSGTEGSANKTSGWKIKDSATGMPEVSKLTWKGSVSCQLSGGPCEDFGINIVDILTFILLVYVAGKFAEVIDNLAADISNSFANLHTENRMDMRGGMMDKASGNTNAGGASPPKGTASALVTGRR